MNAQTSSASSDPRRPGPVDSGWPKGPGRKDKDTDASSSGWGSGWGEKSSGQREKSSGWGDSSGRGSGPGWGESSGSGEPSDKADKTNSGWGGYSGWGSPTGKVDSSWGGSGTGWGSPARKADKADSGWGGTGAGWGSPAGNKADNGWGGTGTGWGSPSGKADKADSGWGVTGSGWGSPGKAGNSWGEPVSAASSTPITSTWSAPTRKDSFTASGSATPMASTPTTSTPTTREAPPLPIARRTSKTSVIEPRKTSLASATSEKGTMGPPPVPASAKGKEVDRTLFKPITASANMSQSASERRPTPKPTTQPSSSTRKEPSTSGPVRLSTKRTASKAVLFKPNKVYKRPTTPAERKWLYREIIRQMKCAVIADVQYRQAHKQRQQWRTASKSNYYMNTAPSGRTRVEAALEDSKKRSDKYRMKRNQHLLELCCLPSLPTKAKVFDIEADKQKVLGYTVELKNWIRALNLPARLAPLLPLEEREEPSHSQPVAQSTDGGTTKAEAPTAPVTAESVIAKEQDLRETWESVQNRIERLNRQLQELHDNAALGVYTDFSFAEFDAKFEDFKQEIIAKREQKELGKINVAINGHSETLGRFDTKLQDQVQVAKTMCERIHAMEQHLEKVRKERIELEESNEEEEKRLKKLEADQEEKSRLIAQLAKEIREKAAAAQEPKPEPEPQPEAESEPAPPKRRRVRPITLEDIGPEIKQILLDRITDEIKPILQSLVDSTKDTTDLVKAELDRMTEPITQKTQAIINYASSVPIATST
ncbi:hypothetical protein CC1G_06577 [Coprinopsis cinerea okayama7|uniref:Uncharacterized protein n=1 Tax=Coprinopsis cinerea (strain Okayama-7 / 130 / ATCC MYA-4618 / FGSC 9003) TaxID=240176 RepID=A8N305_COPC7|nr:hypothetical protein CC1G_06577 [Coprinopsis cinerea okayama7\|eukprot:XP_001829240.2 hypothetical protein CC1G_06577 [Coprinopsis cinerea okayama7\